MTPLYPKCNLDKRYDQKHAPEQGATAWGSRILDRLESRKLRDVRPHDIAWSPLPHYSAPHIPGRVGEISGEKDKEG